MGQTPDGDYAERWKKVDKLISEKGLNRSALSEVEKIYKLAKKEKKDVQMIKALIYMTELSSRIKEETDHGLAMLLSELKTARAPVKQMLHSVVAGKYQHYLEGLPLSPAQIRTLIPGVLKNYTTRSQFTTRHPSPRQTC
jgi:hypothetical protein